MLQVHSINVTMAEFQERRRDSRRVSFSEEPPETRRIYDATERRLSIHEATAGNPLVDDSIFYPADDDFGFFASVCNCKFASVFIMMNIASYYCLILLFFLIRYFV